MTPEQHERAGEILDAALRQLVEEEGFGRLEAVQALISFGIFMLTAVVCRHHLINEYRELQAELERRIAQVPDLEPGVDVARCMGH